MSMLVLSNINLEPIMGYLKSLNPEFAGYGEYHLTLLDHNSRAYNSNIKKIFLFLDATELLGSSGIPKDGIHLENFLETLQVFLKSRPEVLFVTNTLVLEPGSFNSYSHIFQKPLKEAQEHFNDKLVVVAREFSNLFVLDIKELFLMKGFSAYLARNFWYAGRIKYNNLFYKDLADYILKGLAAYEMKAKKVLVLDLDNTLWGGVIGEDGPLGVQLSEDGVGKVYRDAQTIFKALKDIGFILAINSKNNIADVEEVFTKNSMMHLKLEDFVVIRANWLNKVDNLKSIAEELNLGLESMVFIDDSPFERELIRANLPQVTVPDFPSKIHDYCDWLVWQVIYPFFGKYKITEEDRAKTNQYVANSRRKSVEASLNYEDYIKHLEIKLSYYVNSTEHLERMSQITQKTNQFNLTTKRYTTTDILEMINSKKYDFILLDYSDRFGKEGLVGLAIVDKAKGEIDSFMMSCRVIGRGVEDQFIKFIEEQLKSLGHKYSKAMYVKTPKNVLVVNLYEKFGYKIVSSNDATKSYEKELTK
jgi:FkbH-like protein